MMQSESVSEGGVSERMARRLAALVLVGFALLGVGYSLVVPPFETPDEIYHYAFARHLALGNGLPDQRSAQVGRWEQEGSQAPLYYLIVGRLIAGFDHRDFEQRATVNPRANLGDPQFPGNKNSMLYSGEVPASSGTVAAVWVARWFSVALGCVTLWLLYASAALAFADRVRPLLVLLVAAAIPQVAFISASVSNDPMIMATATATVYWLCRLAARPTERGIGLWEWGVLGVLLALAALSKLQGLGLYGLAGMMVLLMGWQRRDAGLVIRAGVAVMLLWLVLAGWWYGRNFLLYGDPLAQRTLLELEGLRTTTPTRGEFWGELRGLRYSFWGLFGWFSILLPVWVYRVLDGLTVVAVVGLAVRAGGLRGGRLRAWLQTPRGRVWVCLGAWLAIMGAAILYWLSVAMGGQGRLILPALGSIVIFLVLGWQAAGQLVAEMAARIWRGAPPPPNLPQFGGGTGVAETHLPPQTGEGRGGVNLNQIPGTHLRRTSRWTTVAVPVALGLGLVGCSVYALVYLLPGTYARPQPLAEVPPDALVVERVYGDVLELVALRQPLEPVAPGEPVVVTLYLRKLRETGQDYELFVQLLNPEIKEIANVTTHPGWGRNPTSLWEVGEVYADTYTLVVEDLRMGGGDTDQPMAARLFVGFRDAQEELLIVEGYAWDIDSMTVGQVLIDEGL